MKIAAAQIVCALGEVAANARKMREFSVRAKEGGAEMIVFPEMSDTGYSMAVIRKCATSWNEGAVPELRKIARDLSIAIVAGVSERDGAHIYNAQVVLDQHGEIIAKYRKTHLFAPAPIEEHTCFTPGDTLDAFPYAGWRFGLSICYDLRFPEVYRRQAARHEANIFLISSAWPFPRVEHLRTLALARAIENQSYLVLANRVGVDDGMTFCGGSAIVDPSGVIVAAASNDREELIAAGVSLGVSKSIRDQMSIFAHRRPELYSSTMV